MVKFLSCGQGYFMFDVFESSSTGVKKCVVCGTVKDLYAVCNDTVSYACVEHFDDLDSDAFIKFFEQDFEVAMQQKARKRTMLLTTLMNRLEDHYKLSQNKERFERETSARVKKLYLAASAARKF